MNYSLKNGDFQYEVTPKVQRTLESVMYWTHCERLDRAELTAAERDRRENGEKSSYSDEEIQKLKRDLEQDELTIRDCMDKMEEEGVPNWVGNGAMYWATTHDLRSHYFQEFFTNSEYADKQNQNAEYDNR